MADRQTDDFKLGNKAADMWLYTADACANEKVIPKKYRYTTGPDERCRGHLLVH